MESAGALRRVSGLLLSIAFLYLMTVVGQAVQYAETWMHDHPPEDIVATWQLSKEDGAEVDLVDARIELSRDGHRIIRTTSATRARRLTRAYDWVVDGERLTYMTFLRTGRPQDEERLLKFIRERSGIRRMRAPGGQGLGGVLRRAALRGEWGWLRPATWLPVVRGEPKIEFANTPTSMQACEGPCNCCPTCECGGRWHVRGYTRDPAGIWTNTTTAQVNWNSSFSRPECNECYFETWTGGYFCQAFAPTSGWTYWYTSGCYLQEDHGTVQVDRYGSTQTTGVYYNYDFGNDNEVTWVLHEIIAGVNGPQTFEAQRWEAGGEYWWFLAAGTLITDGHNSCRM